MKTPFIRGIFNFIDALVLGTSTLMYAASFYDDEAEEDEEEAKEKQELTEEEQARRDRKDKAVMGIVMEYPSMSCTRSFANTYLWARYYKVTAAEAGGTYIFRSENEEEMGAKTSFAMPAGSRESVRQAVASIMEYCRAHGDELFRYLRDRNIYVRHWDAPELTEYLRITVGTDEEMNILFENIRTFL